MIFVPARGIFTTTVVIFVTTVLTHRNNGRNFNNDGPNEKSMAAMVHPHFIAICYEGGLNEKGQFANMHTVAQKRSMAKLIRELSARFPRARIFGHGDLPGVHRACPCYDVGADQNGEKPSQSLKTQPQIRDRPMHCVQKPDPDPGDIYALCAETRLRFEGHFCPVCRNLPQIQGTFMPGG